MTYGLEHFPRLHIHDHRCVHCIENPFELAVERSQLVGEWVKKSGELFGPDEITPTTIISLMSEVLREADGVAGLAKLWIQQLRAACVEEPGSTRAIKGLEGVARFILKSSELSQHREDIARMEPAEIAMELTKYMNSPVIKRLMLDATDGEQQSDG